MDDVSEPPVEKKRVGRKTCRSQKAEVYPGKVADHISTKKANGKFKGNMIKNKDRHVGQPNKRIRSLVAHIADGMTIADAAQAAGIPRSPSNGNSGNAQAEQIVTRPYVRDMIATERAKTAEDHKITRATVLAGLKEAIDMAKMTADPAVMVAGWREIGKMCGFYEAVKVKVDLTSGGATLTTKMMTLSDEDLLRIANGQNLDDDSVIEGQFEQVPQE